MTLSDYSESFGLTRYFFREGDVIGYCKEGRCFVTPSNSSAANFASHAEILRRQNPTRAPVTKPEEIVQVAAENIEKTLGSPKTSAEIDQISTLEQALNLAQGRFASIEPPSLTADIYSPFILDSTSSLLDRMAKTKETVETFKYLWIVGSRGETLGLYFGSKYMIHDQMVIALFGSKLVNDETFIRKFIRGGTIEIQREPEKQTNWLCRIQSTSWDSFGFNPSKKWIIGQIYMSREESDFFYDELYKFMARKKIHLSAKDAGRARK
jgi:hypothetical protein